MTAAKRNATSGAYHVGLRSNNANTPLGPSGDISVYAGIGAGLHVDFILDVNGYYQ